MTGTRPVFYSSHGKNATVNDYFNQAMATLPLSHLRESVLTANLELVRTGLVFSTFGNASGISREQGLVVIKPSGVPYDQMKPEHLVVTDLNGKVLEGNLRPSSDLATHLVLYEAFPEIGGVAHTHSEYATSWAQAQREIPCFGTTHADYFNGPVPITAQITDEHIAGEYEKNTGHEIVRVFQHIDPMAVPGVLVASHGPFVWGAGPVEAAANAATLEFISRLAYFTVGINSGATKIKSALHDRHYFRKHGRSAYYGQPKAKE